MLVAGHPQVLRIANIGSELEGVVAPDVRPVGHPLPLLLALVERAVAPVDVKGVAEIEAGQAFNEKPGHARGEEVVVVQPRNAGVGGRAGANAVRQHLHAVPEEAKAEVGQQVGTEHVVKARRQALVARQSLTGKAVRGKAPAAHHLAERADGGLAEVGEAIPAEDFQILACVVVQAQVESVVVEQFGATVAEIVLDPRARVGRRQPLQEGHGLRRNAGLGNDGTREGRAAVPGVISGSQHSVRPRGAGQGVENLHPVLTQVATDRRVGVQAGGAHPRGRHVEEHRSP